MTENKQNVEPDKMPDTPSAPLLSVPSASRSKFPAVGDVLAMLGIFLVSLFVGTVVSVIVGGAPLRAGDPLPPAVLGRMLGVSSLVTYGLTLAGMLTYRKLRGGHGRIARFSARGFDPVLLLWGLVFLLALGVVLEPLLSLLPAPPMDNLGSGLWTLAALVVFAPVFEELICRGVVLESLRARYGVITAWLVSSLFFAVLHFQLQMALNAFFVGLVLAFLYIRTDSLWITILLHAFNNAAAYLLMRMGYSCTMLSEMIGNRTVYTIVYVIAAVVCAASAWMVYRTLKRRAAAAKIGTTA